MKRVLALLFVLSLIVGVIALSACGETTTPTTQTEAVATTLVPTEAATTAATEATEATTATTAQEFIAVEGDRAPSEPLSDALLHEIEECFKATPGSIPLYRYGEYSEKIGMMIPYYGTYDGYVVFAVEGALQIVTVLRIAGEIFYHHQIMTFYAYKDGEITKLEDLYAAGKISDEAIKEIAAYHREFNDIEEYYAKDVVDHIDDTCVPFEFRSETVESIKDAWKDEDHAPEYIVPLLISGDTYVFALDRSLKYYTYKTFGDFVFRGYTPGYIFVYRDGEIMTLDAAFDKGYLDEYKICTVMFCNADWVYVHKTFKNPNIE